MWLFDMKSKCDGIPMFQTERLSLLHLWCWILYFVGLKSSQDVHHLSSFSSWPPKQTKALCIHQLQVLSKMHYWLSYQPFHKLMYWDTNTFTKQYFKCHVLINSKLDFHVKRQVSSWLFEGNLQPNTALLSAVYLIIHAYYDHYYHYALHIMQCIMIQGVFSHWYPPIKLKYGKPRLGESTLT